MTVDRRRFLKGATAGVGVALAGCTSTAVVAAPTATGAPTISGGGASDVVVIGTGSFGMWTALNLRRLGASVTVIDPYGAGNSRQTSGGETRGVRSSYGDRPHGLLWTRWVQKAIRRWKQWDGEGFERLSPRLFFNTGDLILSPEVTPYLEDTQANWDTAGVDYEVLAPEEIARRWPWIRLPDITVGLFEPGAGVVRARRAMESVATVFQQQGGRMRLGRAMLGDRDHSRLVRVNVEPGEPQCGETFIYACGPWFPKVFPQLMGKRLRIPIGHTFYFGVPPGDTRFMFPNMPSYGVPGCTGWPALGSDHRGFRVRTGGRPPEDPDFSDGWIDKQFHDRPRQILEDYFPGLVDAPILETRACHYEISFDRNFIVDRHPDFDNVWLAGGGSAEAFKFGPVVGEYVARRVLGVEDDPELAQQFRLKQEEFEEEEEEQPGRASRRSMSVNAII